MINREDQYKYFCGGKVGAMILRKGAKHMYESVHFFVCMYNVYYYANDENYFR